MNGHGATARAMAQVAPSAATRGTTSTEPGPAAGQRRRLGDRRHAESTLSGGGTILYIGLTAP